MNGPHPTRGLCDGCGEMTPQRTTITGTGPLAGRTWLLCWRCHGRLIELTAHGGWRDAEEELRALLHINRQEDAATDP